jgi:hypothetical protein
MKLSNIIPLILILCYFVFLAGCASALHEGLAVVKGAKIAVAISNATASTAENAQTNAQTDSYYQKKAESIASAIDYQNSVVHNFALQQISRSHSGDYTTGQICDIWDSIHNKWTYVSDAANLNYYTPASDSIKNGLKGNCLDYAILNAAAIESIGGSTRVITVDSPSEDGHAYAEVYVADDKSELLSLETYIGERYHPKFVYHDEETTSDGQTHYWLNLDWQSNYPGGEFYKGNGTRYAFYPNGAYMKIGNN